jgi:uncharacterized protein involved in exopolysaccharide biosynthesis
MGHEGAVLSVSDGDADEERQISLLALFNVLMRRRRLIAAVAALAALITAVVTLARPRVYTVSATLMPQSAPQVGAGALSGLAAQFGVSLGSSSAGQSPAFYAELLRSRVILEGATSARYEVHDDGKARRGSLADLLGIEARTPERRQLLTRLWLADNLKVSTTRETGLVRVSVSTRWPELSLQIADTLLARLDSFNRERRRTNAGTERAFVEERLRDSQGHLQVAEQQLLSFLQRNREYANAPLLAYEYERLQREVMREQTLNTSLAQAFEQARLEEVRNTPVVTVIEPPELPARPDSRLLLVKLLVALVVGTLIGSLLALASAGFGGAGTASADREEFIALRRATLQDLRRPWRVLTRDHRST